MLWGKARTHDRGLTLHVYFSREHPITHEDIPNNPTAERGGANEVGIDQQAKLGALLLTTGNAIICCSRCYCSSTACC